MKLKTFVVADAAAALSISGFRRRWRRWLCPLQGQQEN